MCYIYGEPAPGGPKTASAVGPLVDRSLQKNETRMAATSRKYGAGICIRLSTDERAKLNAFCDAKGITTSEAIRRFVRELSGFGPTLDGEDRKTIIDLTRQGRAIGNSLNQWVKAMNAGLVPRQDKLAAWIKETHRWVLETSNLHKSLCEKSYRRSQKIFQSGDAA